MKLLSLLFAAPLLALASCSAVGLGDCCGSADCADCSTEASDQDCGCGEDCGCTAAGPTCGCTDATSGWLDLWDGESLAGWSMAGPGEFQIVDGSLMATGGMGLLWYSDADFQDFTLALEWAAEDASDNSGVFVRFPDPGNDPWVAVNQGYELQICDAADAMHNTGSVYSFQGSTHIPTKPAGEWNTYEISVVDQHYTVKVNGEVVNEFDGERSAAGHVGLQNHDDGSPVRFRNLRVLRHEG
ncbi:MAG: DUF1080 domain-containing protein [Planctomycetota bacterium]|nr:DUF1080 domain-containing protein [Planctomycetota bacterium]